MQQQQQQPFTPAPHCVPSEGCPVSAGLHYPTDYSSTGVLDPYGHHPATATDFPGSSSSSSSAAAAMYVNTVWGQEQVPTNHPVYYESYPGAAAAAMYGYPGHMLHDGHAAYPDMHSEQQLSESGKRKRRRVISYDQRKAANVRERKRMCHLNDAFDVLRKRVPTFAYEKKLSRIETLKLAVTYIQYMAELLGDIEEDGSSKLNSSGGSDGRSDGSSTGKSASPTCSRSSTERGEEFRMEDDSSSPSSAASSSADDHH